MYAILRKYAEWRGRRKGAQVIVFDGAAEIQKTGAFVKGAVAGMLLATAVVSLTAPTTVSPHVLEEFEQREELLRASNERTEQAIRVADVCLSTAQSLERTLSSYQNFLGSRTTTAATDPPFGAR